MYANAHATLDDETIEKKTGLSCGDKIFAFMRGFYALKGLPNFFTQQISLFFKGLVHQGSALVFEDVILLMSNSKPHVQQLIKQLDDIAKWGKSKLAPEKFLIMILTA